MIAIKKTNFFHFLYYIVFLMKEKIVSNNSVEIHPLQNPPLCSSTDMPAFIDKGEEGANEDDSSLGLF
jgi:hypothetical protein